jgi:dihydroxyacid dehydratase/phosphogluconate dehydratase
MYYAMGYKEEDFSKPMIGVAETAILQLLPVIADFKS